MKFNVTIIDPANYKYAYLATDLCRLVTFGLRSLGHDCDMSVNNFDASAINIVAMTHLLSEQDINAIMSAGLKYICIQTETLFPGQGDVRVMSAFQGDQFERKCRRFYEGAVAIWEPYDSNMELLRLFDIPPERLKKLSLGFHEKLIDVEHRPRDKKDIDVLFFGSVSDRRRAVFNGLVERGFRTVALLDAPAAFRNDLIARARLNINIHNSDTFRHLSLTRATYLLNNRASLVSETSDTHPELRSLIFEADYHQLPERCAELLSSSNLDELTEKSFQQFMETPMSGYLREIV